jgi:hypothetical protein
MISWTGPQEQDCALSCKSHPVCRLFLLSAICVQTLAPFA